ncbi:MAG: hypothetical protein ACPLRW_01640 [Moorellales bacterium]
MTVVNLTERRLQLLRKRVAAARDFDQVRTLVLGAPEVLAVVLERMGLPHMPPEGMRVEAELQFKDNRYQLEFSWVRNSREHRDLIHVDCHGGYCRPGRWSIDTLYAAHLSGRAPGEVLPGAYWVSLMCWDLRLVPAYLRGWSRWLENVQWLMGREVFLEVTRGFPPTYVRTLLNRLLAQAVFTAYTRPALPFVLYYRHQLPPGCLWDGPRGVEISELLRKVLKALNVAGLAVCPGPEPSAGPDEPVIFLRPVPVLNVLDCEQSLADALAARSRAPAGGTS